MLPKPVVATLLKTHFNNLQDSIEIAEWLYRENNHVYYVVQDAFYGGTFRLCEDTHPIYPGITVMYKTQRST